ncbi:peptidyl-tRNA hydrolase [Thecamonas trahens ATCC 50062]|uniref:Peptidyl-tRNA hydrolase n=1 Tax=Thecamonas trahens ATCC 50062 TaxID=461836 RepID=A0A0L0D134_THETB|nr:peptidyl-tRNA hydrolase [Thecamonas trahens ATCC 50062]KNC45941.1 peptidyl-tRNA hydrolase [Thecamonas trahens ATCC 50062]|eukprot:XP_013762924.1 peptidyl-tRNA hydrolase [Thecamonas trahens ATCC 50062]
MLRLARGSAAQAVSAGACLPLVAAATTTAASTMSAAASSPPSSSSHTPDGDEGDVAAPAHRVAMVGLGNPGRSYAYTRHNAGATVLAALVAKYLEPAHGVRSAPECWRGGVEAEASAGGKANLLSATVQCYEAMFEAPMSGLTREPWDAIDVLSVRAAAATREHGVSHPTAHAALIFPHTYMNRSGIAVAQFADAYGLELGPEGSDLLLVCYDDLNLPLGALKLVSKRTRKGEKKIPHNGLRSVCSKLPDGSLVARLRIGIGRPTDGTPVTDFVLSEFDSSERKALHAVASFATHVIRVLLHRGVDRAANIANNYTASEFASAYARAISQRAAESLLPQA